MALLRSSLVGAAMLALVSPALAQPAAAPTPAVLAPPADTPLGSGPYPAIMEPAVPALPGQTVYRPTDLSPFADNSLPVVLWGNGACANKGNDFRAFLSEIASYGYVAIALGPIDPSVPLYEPQNIPAAPTAAPAAPPRLPPPGAMPPPRTRSAQLIEALDWASGEQRRASEVGRKLNPGAVAVMGMSCGGAQAIEAGADPRVSTVVLWNSGLFPDGTNMGGGEHLTKEDHLMRLRVPTAYITGDASDIAFANADDDYQRLAAAGVPIFRGWQRGVGHGGNYGRPGGGEFAGVAVAWLNWRLKGDERAAGMFRGENCGLCVNPRWVTQSANLE